MPSRLTAAERDLLKIRDRLRDRDHIVAVDAINLALRKLRRIHR